MLRILHPDMFSGKEKIKNTCGHVPIEKAENMFLSGGFRFSGTVFIQLKKSKSSIGLKVSDPRLLCNTFCLDDSTAALWTVPRLIVPLPPEDSHPP